MTNLAAMKAILMECLALKALPRTGWVRMDVPTAESVAAHSWGVAWLVLALCPPQLDRGRALAIAVVHDLAEVRVGDITPHDGVPKAVKANMEAAAFEQLAAPFAQRAELLDLYAEYAEAATPEGRFVKACDKLDMALQAQAYERAHAIDLSQFVDSALARLTQSDFKALIASA